MKRCRNENSNRITEKAVKIQSQRETAFSNGKFPDSIKFVPLHKDLLF